MNPPPWNSPNVEKVRTELMRRVEDQAAPTPVGHDRAWAEQSRGSILRVSIALAVALMFTVPASIYVLSLASRPGLHGGPAGPSALLSAGPSTTSSPRPTSTPATRAAAGAGCPATAQAIPTDAFRATVDDMDGDGRPDIEWATVDDGNLHFGITTASGATISGEQGFAGGGDRSFVVGRLRNGVVVAITSEGRDSPVYTFSGCRFHALLGKSLLPGSTADTPFELYSENAGGSGGCFAGRLALVQLAAMPGDPSGDRERAIARWIDVSADGLHATLTSSTDTIATDLSDRTAPRRYGLYSGISCGASKVLFPIIRSK